VELLGVNEVIKVVVAGSFKIILPGPPKIDEHT